MQGPILNTPLHVSLIDPENIIDARSVHIAECWSATDLNRAEAELVAAEIVRRVNLHDELVAALRIIANSEAIDGDTVVCDFETLQRVASDALTKAEG